MRIIPIIALSLLILTTTAQASQKLEIAPFCDATDNQLVFFTIVNVDVNHKGEKSKVRYLYKADCNLPTSTCAAVAIKLEALESKNSLDMLDVILPDSLKIINRNKKVFTLGWGPFVTFTVDLPANRVTYRESAPDFENYGVGYCTRNISKK